MNVVELQTIVADPHEGIKGPQVLFARPQPVRLELAEELVKTAYMFRLPITLGLEWDGTAVQQVLFAPVIEGKTGGFLACINKQHTWGWDHLRTWWPVMLSSPDERNGRGEWLYGFYGLALWHPYLPLAQTVTLTNPLWRALGKLEEGEYGGVYVCLTPQVPGYVWRMIDELERAGWDRKRLEAARAKRDGYCFSALILLLGAGVEGFDWSAFQRRVWPALRVIANYPGQMLLSETPEGLDAIDDAVAAIMLCRGGFIGQTVLSARDVALLWRV